MKRLRTHLVAAGFLACAVSALAAPFDPVLDADPFAMEAMLADPPKDVATREFLEGAVDAGRLNTDSALRHLHSAWSAPGVSPAVTWHALSLAGHTMLRAGRYREAGEYFDRAISEHADVLTTEQRRDLDQSRGVAMALRDERPQSTAKVAAGRVPLGTDMLGLTTAPVLVDGHAEQAVLDTGANLSTLSTSAAKALGVCLLKRDTAVASSTTATVDTKIAVARTVRIGSVTLRDVVFLVVDDAALSPLGPESRIDAIIGFPLLSALGRITFHEIETGKPGKRRELMFAPSSRTATPGNLRFDGFNAYVRLTAGEETLPFFVDSGANKTVFEYRYARENPEKIAKLARKTARVGGAGLVENREAAILPALALRIGDKTVALADVRIELKKAEGETTYGTVGSDVLWAKGGYTMDFGKLNLTLGR
jgi:predicted aspartyl protease